MIDETEKILCILQQRIVLPHDRRDTLQQKSYNLTD